MAVVGGLALVARGAARRTATGRWIAAAKEGAEQIRDIVKRMNQITTIEEVPRQGALPPMLDIRKSSTPPLALTQPRRASRKRRVGVGRRVGGQDRGDRGDAAGAGRAAPPSPAPA